MGTELLQAAPYPDTSDAPDGPAQILALGQWAAKKVVQVYADGAARGAAFTTAGVTPTEGMAAYVQDANRLEIYTGVYWCPTPGTELAYKEVTDNADQATAGSAQTTVAGLQVSFTLAGQMAVMIRTHCSLQSSVSGDVGLLLITDAANTAIARSGDIALDSSARNYGAEFGQRLVLPAGSYTYKTRRQRISGTGGLFAPSNLSDLRNWIQVTCCGPA